MPSENQPESDSENEKQNDLLTRLRNLHELVKPPEGVRDDARPYMHFGDAMVYHCDSCNEINLPGEVWDLGVAQPDGEDPKADRLGPSYLTLFSVIMHDSEEETTREEDKKAWRDGESLCYALLEVLESLPKLVSAVEIGQVMYNLLDRCAEAGVSNSLAREIVGIRLAARRILDIND